MTEISGKNVERGSMESQKTPPKMHFLKRLLPMSIQLWHFQNACFQQIWCVAQQREGGRQLDIHIQILEVCFLFFLCMFAAVKLVQNMNLWLPNSPRPSGRLPIQVLIFCSVSAYYIRTSKAQDYIIHWVLEWDLSLSFHVHNLCQKVLFEICQSFFSHMTEYIVWNLRSNLRHSKC